MTAQTAAQQVGERIHLMMWRHGITQRKLADVVGVSQGMVSRKLRGVTPMTVTELFQIAGALGVDVVELLQTQNDPDTAVVSGPSLLPRLDSNQQPSGYVSAQVRAGVLVDLDAARAARRAS